MVLQQSKFSMKGHKPKYFRMIFHQIKYYQNQNLRFKLCHQNNNTCDF